jgi:hypothetical protein
LMSHIVFISLFICLLNLGVWSHCGGPDRIIFQHGQEFSRTLRLLRNSAGLRMPYATPPLSNGP